MRAAASLISSSVSTLSIPAICAASRVFGVITSARLTSTSLMALAASGTIIASMPLHTITGSITTFFKLYLSMVSATSCTSSALPSMPVFMASMPMPSTMVFICFSITSMPIGYISWSQLSGFCATITVSAVMPYTPMAVNVFKSASMPAPPLVSLPAMVIALCNAILKPPVIQKIYVFNTDIMIY